MASIEHVFVLMMENRSFDHLFGFSGHADLPLPDPTWEITGDAPDRLLADPKHEFEDVAAQIAGQGPQFGFAKQADWPTARQAFGAADLPVLRALANQYFLFDNWYSSLPGPTWPNRFFVHAGSSAGLSNSPSSATTIESATIDTLSFDFPNGTIFDKLSAAGHRWRVYHDDLFPQVLAVKGMIDPFRVNDDRFRWIHTGNAETFRQDLANDYDVHYTFIEPDYGLSSNGFKDGNCQHPVGSMAAGEAFIKYIYDSVSSSPVWPNSLLLITYDEHGGFYDHAPPPLGIPPADGNQNADRAENPVPFAFDRLGVRVPTIAISPRILPGGLGSKTFPGINFDHTSIIKTVMKIFQTPGNLGARVEQAPAFDSIVSPSVLAANPSGVPINLPDPASPSIAAAVESLAAPSTADSTVEGFTRIAMSLDLSMQDDPQTSPPVALAHATFTDSVAIAPHPVAAPPDAVGRRVLSSGRTQEQSLNYIQSVADKVKRRRGVLNAGAGKA